MKETKTHNLINSVIAVADKFIDKVDTGRARSKETYQELLKLKIEAIMLRQHLKVKNKS